MSNEEAINIVNEMTCGDDSVSSVARQLVCIDILGLDVVEWAKTPIENLVSESSHEALSPAVDTYIDTVTAEDVHEIAKKIFNGTKYMVIGTGSE